jgi:glycerophosphoryl diester phosphodiesterase
MPRPARPIEIVCHKGANEYAPENTYAAAQLCLDWGMDYVEIDVNLSKDEVHYLLHGPDVDQTTGGSGPFCELTSAEIDRLDAGSWFGPRFAGERVPRLEPFLRWIKGRAGVFLDVKAANLEQLIQTIYRIGLEADCFFWFGKPDMTLRFRELDERLSLKVNVKSVSDVIEAVEVYRANIVEVQLKDMSADLRAACRQNGLKLMIYHPEKDAEAFRRIIDWDVDLINLNHGDLFARLLAERADDSSA